MDKPTFSVEDARAAIAADQQQRLEACRAEIADALRKHRCRIMAVIILTQDGRQASAQPQIVAE